MKDKKKTLLWEIRREEAPGPSYVFGTMHVQDQRAFAFREQAYGKIAQCDIMALEFDLGEAPAGMDPSLLRLPEGLTLTQLIPDKKFRKIRKVFRKVAGIDLYNLQYFSPIVVSNLINERILSQDMPLSLDEHLWKYARSLGKPVVGIESYREQLEILRQMPLEHQVASLVEMGQHIRRHRRQLLRMAEIYKEGDIFKLYRTARRSASGLRQLLLYRRNRIMAERLSELAAGQRVFCAIGAGHLAGGKGVLRYLKREGWRVRPG
ncbi:MAG: TraB/GumN family protein [Lewinellaceae bacterium]|nr:TraB/GumN family protein [Lewinellaceae bacterium]